MCNSIKNLIQQSKIDSSLKSSMSNGKVSRSSSIQSDSKKSFEKLSPLKKSEESPKSFISNRNQEPKKNGCF